MKRLSKRLLGLGTILAILALVSFPAGVQAASGPLPGIQPGWRLPFTGAWSVTQGPGQGDHTCRSGYCADAEAIDFAPRPGGPTDLLAIAAGTVVYSDNTQPATSFGDAGAGTEICGKLTPSNPGGYSQATNYGYGNVVVERIEQGSFTFFALYGP